MSSGLKAARRAVGDAFFINARTDIFLKAKPDTHDAAAADAAIERALAYADAGASGYFIPGLANLELVERITKASPIPVNAMWLPGGPRNEQWASAGNRADQPRAVSANRADARHSSKWRARRSLRKGLPAPRRRARLSSGQAAPPPAPAGTAIEY